MELTILMPCLNEEETLEICIKKAKDFLEKNDIDGEVLIADNGSTDKSVEIAEHSGARVVHVEQKGYGSALRAGCDAANGKFVIMGDADDSYDFVNLMPFVEKLREGYELVMGNRFAGGIEKGAMPWSHKYIGNPILSFIGRLFFKSPIRDFHCGLRGYNKESVQNLHLQTTGMEYASEMVVMSQLAGLKIAEVPTTLKKDGRSRPPHLRSFHDGWRHLKFLFMYSPKWLFFYPGIILLVFGIVFGTALTLTDIKVGNVSFGIHTMLYCMLAVIIGTNCIYFFIFTKLYAEKTHFIPRDKMMDKLLNIDVDRNIFIGGFLFLLGLALSILSVAFWKYNSFGALLAETAMRRVIPAVTLMAIGIEMIFANFFIGILKIEGRNEN